MRTSTDKYIFNKSSEIHTNIIDNECRPCGSAANYVFTEDSDAYTVLKKIVTVLRSSKDTTVKYESIKKLLSSFNLDDAYIEYCLEGLKN